MNLIAIIACLMAGGTLGVLVMACFVAGSKADDWADEYEHAESDSAVRERMKSERMTNALYPERRKVL